jgi:hypothetical protein
MATEITQENFSIDFDEQRNVVEVQYQGVNAALLATLAGRVDDLESELDAAVASTSGGLGTLSISLSSLSTLVTALSGTVNADQAARIAGDEANTADILARHNTAMAAIANETSTRAAALLAEAAARGAAERVPGPGLEDLLPVPADSDARSDLQGEAHQVCHQPG